jgi:hypothetical protein
VGVLSFFSRAVPLSRAYLRRLYSCLHDGLHGSHDYDIDVELTPEGKQDLLWWSKALVQFRNAQVLRGLRATIIKQHTDASGDGWDCTLEEYGSGVVEYCYGNFTSHLSSHTSNFCELFTIYKGLRECRELHPERVHLRIIAYTDNAVAASCVNKGTANSEELLPLVKEIGLFMVEHGITCQAVWIPGRQLIKQGADPLSRGAYPFEHFSKRVRGEFDPYFAKTSIVPDELRRTVEEAMPDCYTVEQPCDWCHEQLEGRLCLLAPPPSATRSALLHYFDAHRRHSKSTSGVAVVACVASSEWFRLSRYFGDHIVVRYDRAGVKLIYPVMVAYSPELRCKAQDCAWWQRLRASLWEQTKSPDSRPRHQTLA